jgi:hypothetical protein
MYMRARSRALNTAIREKSVRVSKRRTVIGDTRYVEITDMSARSIITSHRHT